MNGKEVNYEYDSRNRLHLIRDEDNNIVERYRYNYGQEDNSLSATISISGGIIAGSSQRISADFDAYGETEIKWFDASGSLISTNKSFTYNGFSGTSSKTIRLVLVNPEYDAPYNGSASKTFYNEWSVNSVAGSSTICLVTDGEEIIPEGGGGGTSPEYYSITVSGGGTTCGYHSSSSSFTYQWQHNKNGVWSGFGTNSNSVELPESLRFTTGSFEVRVLVSNACDSKYSNAKTVTVESCGSGGGPGGGGCSEVISTTPSSIHFTNANQTHLSVTVNTSASGFSVSDNRSWISTSKSGSTFSVTVTGNSGQARGGTVTVTDSNGCTTSMTIFQEGQLGGDGCPPGCTYNLANQRCEDPNGDPCLQH